MFLRLLISQLGGIISAASQLNARSTITGGPVIFEFQAGVPKLNPDLRLSPAPRFVVGWRGIRLTEVYFQQLSTGKEIVVNLDSLALDQ